MRRLVVLPLLAALLMLPGSAQAARRQVPPGWMGMSADAFFTTLGTRAMSSEAGAMVTAGVETLRYPFFWSDAQPCPNFFDAKCGDRSRFVSVAGVPTDFSVTDRIVATAAKRHIRLLPTLLSTPRWDFLPGVTRASRPRDPQLFANYAAALVGRYGPRGTFWKHRHDRQPIRTWQIWNEPNFGIFWCSRRDTTASDGCADLPWARDYVQLLRMTRQAIKRRDRGAKLVLAGFANYTWLEMGDVYRAGGRRLFDFAAVHAFTKDVDRVVQILGRTRATMRRSGDARKPLYVTETTWSSGRGLTSQNHTWVTTRRGQAARVGQLFTRLARLRTRLRIAGVDWFTWVSPPSTPGRLWDRYSGLREVSGARIVSKPALKAYRDVARRLEGCRKRRFVDRCG